jgi:CRISPR/Cas system-associated exonuclease Cas4 (RecB family)
MSESDDGHVPWRFELAFGLGQGSLAGRRLADPGSTVEPAQLDCGVQLRGSIDLVERSQTGERASLRITDHKTGRVRFGKNKVIDGGKVLQPVLYALAAEKLFPDAQVEEGRLYYCTSTGGFTSRSVPLDDEARDAAQQLADSVADGLDRGFLPAAPAERACRFCDFKLVCGPYEELRTGRKTREPLGELLALRART